MSNTKKCYGCHRELSATPEIFGRCKTWKDGLQQYCKECKKKQTVSPESRRKHNEYHKKRRKNPKYKDNYKNASLKTQYGITLKEHKKMYLRQNGCCAICNKPIEYDKICTDHNHTTNKVRGLLCFSCNHDMYFIDENDWFEKAKKYVKNYD